MVFLLRPIMRVKARTELRTASEIMKTLHGDFPLVTCRIEGGHLSMPRWGASFRRGKILGVLMRRYTVEALCSMSYEEREAAIHRDSYFTISRALNN